MDEPLKIVISLSGGNLNAVYGPDDMEIVILDWDNINEGDEIVETFSDGSVDSDACQEEIRDAEARVAQLQKETEKE